MMAEVSGVWVQGRPWLNWMHGVNVALDSRLTTVEAARQCVTDRKESRTLVHMWTREIHPPYLLGFCVL